MGGVSASEDLKTPDFCVCLCMSAFSIAFMALGRIHGDGVMKAARGFRHSRARHRGRFGVSFVASFSRLESCDGFQDERVRAIAKSVHGVPAQ
jgi:hypothetical protein